jgi:DNA-binding GntR family transcriptional regulator
MKKLRMARRAALIALLSLVLWPPLASGESGPESAVPEAPAGAHSANAQRTFDEMDTRTPLPLTATMAAHQKTNMRDHLAAVQEIVAALAAGDMPAVREAARRIGYSDAMAQMCRHMGTGAPGFTDMALTFHRTADTIADAAGRGDRQAATAALAATLGTCVGCHAVYRQQVVDETTWQRLTTGPAHAR